MGAYQEHSDRPDHIGPYDIEEWLGEGGMGEVCRARDRRLDRMVAIKRIRGARLHERATRERFRREAWSVAQLNHPAIVQIYDVFADEDHDWIVMEYVDGDTLTHRLKKGPLDPAVVLTLMYDVASGLAEAHASGIVHRDIKADNIMITHRGHAKILDFGLARPIEPNNMNPAVTMVGAILGTPHAMSPEQAAGQELDHRSDLFSLGSLFYLALTGRAPFRGPTALETLRRVRTRGQPPAKFHRPEIPQALSDLIDHLLEKDAARRPQKTEEVARQLDAMVKTPFTEWPQHTPPVEETKKEEDDGPTAITELTSIISAGRQQVTALVCEALATGISGPSGSWESAAQPLRKIANEVLEDLGAEIQPRAEHNKPEILTIACFGFPKTREDDALRAVVAARRIVERARRESTRQDVALRIGVHTDQAWISGDEIELGDAGIHAAGVAQRGGVGEVIVSGSTETLVREGFRCDLVSEMVAPGEPLPFRLTGERDVEAYLETLRGAPLIGREAERQILMNRWRLVREGRGQAVLLSGPRGCGKSRLLQDLLDNNETADAFRLVCRCRRHERGIAFAPLIRLMRRLLRCDESADCTHQDLEAFLGPFGAALGRTLPAFHHLISQDLEEPEEVTEQPENRVQDDIRAALVQLLSAMATRSPVLLLVEDVEEIDDESFRLLEMIVRQGPAVPMLTIMTSRTPGMRLPQMTDSLSYLSLGPLGRRESAEIIRRVAAPTSLPTLVVDALGQRADGVPFFLEELTQALCESEIDFLQGDPALLKAEIDYLPIPLRLHDLLMAKLDAQGSGRRLAQEASVIGRHVSKSELEAVSSFNDKDLKRLLKRLVDNEIFYRRSENGDARYFFRYALLQEAAVNSLPASERHDLQIAVEALPQEAPTDV